MEVFEFAKWILRVASRWDKNTFNASTQGLPEDDKRIKWLCLKMTLKSNAFHHVNLKPDREIW